MAALAHEIADFSPARPNPPTHVLETCLYVKCMDDAVAFYRDVLGLTPTVSSPRLTMFPLGMTSLILFQLGMTEEDTIITAKNTGDKLMIPGHGPDRSIIQSLMGGASRTMGSRDAIDGGQAATKLRTHFCLAVPSRNEVLAWESYLKENNAKVRGVMEWERGGRSVYFEDVDGHVGEIGSRGIWEHY